MKQEPSAIERDKFRFRPFSEPTKRTVSINVSRSDVGERPVRNGVELLKVLQLMLRLPWCLVRKGPGHRELVYPRNWLEQHPFGGRMW